jgi:site-specific DNA-cytosine methylase
VTVRLLELFSGIGGVSAAVAGTGLTVVGAVDTDEAANRVHEMHWDAPVHRRNLSARRLDFLPDADVWWMSPPCQPFTVRGRRADLDDPRCAPFLRLLDAWAERRPTWLVLENVPGFLGSRAHALLRARLAAHGAQVAEGVLCPLDFGLPTLRRRAYLIAGPEPPTWPEPPKRPRPAVRTFLDADPDPALTLADSFVARFATALPFATPDDTDTCCFTSAYGHSPVYCGSYLRDGGPPRRFSPDEIARLLGFPRHFHLPEDLPLRKRWALVGNSVAVPVVRALLAPLARTVDRPIAVG